MPTLKPLAGAPAAVWRDKRFVLLDIDDTLTTDGRLPAASYGALEALDESRAIPDDSGGCLVRKLLGLHQVREAQTPGIDRELARCHVNEAFHHEG